MFKWLKRLYSWIVMIGIYTTFSSEIIANERRTAIRKMNDRDLLNALRNANKVSSYLDYQQELTYRLLKKKINKKEEM